MNVEHLDVPEARTRRQAVAPLRDAEGKDEPSPQSPSNRYNPNNPHKQSRQRKLS
ncbi:hypothetical protein [Schlesneria sp. T3-172]|uniref:hypothetical protein n=1 Tax=Schlesneria sphaerica TaxID=3373610 RepID=UPI0037CB9F72